MLLILRKWFTRLRGFASRRFARWFRPAAAGHWTSGEHYDAEGRLAQAPFIRPARKYHLYFPANYREEPLPLIVLLHGCKQDGKAFARGAGLTRLADRDHMMLLCPEQHRLANPFRCWNWFDTSSRDGKGEAAIVAGLVRVLIGENKVDPARIYVAGISAGGALVSTLASCYAEMFAAGAVHSGLMFQAASSPAVALSVMRHGSQRDPEEAGKAAFEISGNKVAAMPMMVIHGDADDTVHPVNGEQTVAQFLAMNGIDDAPRIVEKSHRHYRYEILDYGPEAAPILRFVKVKGLGHAWSGGDSRYPYNDAKGPDASEMMLAFFVKHRREESLPK